MAAMSIRLPESLHQSVKEFAAREGVSVNQVIALTLAEKMAELKVVGYLERLRQQPEVSTQTFLDILDQAPDVEPENPLYQVALRRYQRYAVPCLVDRASERTKEAQVSTRGRLWVERQSVQQPGL